MSKDQQNMTPLSDADREALSAMVDGEAESLEIRRILKLSASQNQQHVEAVTKTWSRYNRIQEAARGEASGFQHLDISQAVSSAIAGETPDQVIEPLTAAKTASSWGKSLKGLAVAASVAVVTVVGVNVLQQGGVNNATQGGASIAVVDDTSAPVQAQPRATFTTGANSQLAAFGSNPISQGAMPADEQRFNQGDSLSTYDLSQAKERRAQELRKMEGYLLKHSQNAAMSNSTHGMIPMARAVNYDTPE